MTIVTSFGISDLMAFDSDEVLARRRELALLRDEHDAVWAEWAGVQYIWIHNPSRNRELLARGNSLAASIHRLTRALQDYVVQSDRIGTA